MKVSKHSVSFRDWAINHIYQDSFRIAAIQRFCGIRWKNEAKHSYPPGSPQYNMHKKRVERIRKSSACYVQSQGEEYNLAHSYSMIIHIIFVIGAALGEEIFYFLFIPLLPWILSEAIARRFVPIWMLVYYIGQLLKEIFALPRPMQPPVLRLQPNYAQEYGFPSTHAMSAAAVPFYLWYLITGGDTNTIVFVIACVWFSIMTFSRFYMGVHSTYDVAGGIVLGVIIYRIMKNYADTLDVFLIEYEQGYLYTAVVAFVLIVIYWVVTKPDDRHWSPTFGDTTVVIGVACGGAIAMNILTNYYIPASNYPAMLAGHALEGLLRPDGNYTVLEYAGINPATGIRYFPFIITGKYKLYHSLGWAVARVVVGYTVLALCRVIVKYSMYPIITRIIPRPKGIPADQPPSHIYRYEIPVKLATYGTIGFASAFVCQNLFHLLEI